MTDKKTERIEREYTIPLREKCRSVARYKKTPKAVKSVKEFLAKHMKVADRDTRNVRIDRLLNEALWNRGIKNPLHKVKVKAIKEDGIVRAYAVDLTPSLNFKKLREERKSKEAQVIAESNKKAKQKEEKKEEVKEEVKEKEEASKLAEEQIEKEMAKEVKHTSKTKSGREKQAEKKGHDKTSQGQ